MCVLETLAKSKLKTLRENGSYRNFFPLSNNHYTRYPYFLSKNGFQLLNMCLNDYLGLSQSELAKSAAIYSINQFGVGTGASRNIGGTRDAHFELENELRSLHQTEDCLLYNSANSACTDVISLIAKLYDCTKFFSDRENHASLIEGMRNLREGDRKYIFDHNNIDHLKLLVRSNICGKDIPVLVIESNYSMSGTFSPLLEMVHYIRSLGGIIILNEVHSVGIYNDDGSGRASLLGVSQDIDVIIGSLSKAYGVIGGYIVGSHSTIDLFRQLGTKSIFTTSLPHFVCAAALANVRYRRKSLEILHQMWEKIAYLRSRLIYEGLQPLWNNYSQITPIIIGDENRCIAIAKFILEQGFYVTPIRFPTVPLGKAQFRITVNPYHSLQDIDRFCKAIGTVLRD